MKYLFILLFLLPCTVLAQQNHIYNGSFEYYSSCPSTYGQIANATGWSSYTNGSPDYFHVCNVSYESVPKNFAGIQDPEDGSAYIGIVTHNGGFNYREYVTQSIVPLIKGARYQVALSVSLAGFQSNSGMYAPSVYFFENGPANVSTTTFLGYTPQVTYSSAGLILDTTNWTRVSAYFTPDSNYSNIVIGNFLDDASTPSQSLYVNGALGSYYYIDSVAVKLAPYIHIIQTDTVVCAGDSISVQYTVESGAPFTSSSTFTLELSNASGSFASPLAIGSITGTTSAGIIKGLIPASLSVGTGYRVRIKASSPFDQSFVSSKNIKVNKVTVTASSNSPVCQHGTLNLTASSITGASYSWTGPLSFSSTLQNPTVTSIQPANAGTYTVKATANGCTSAPQTINVVVVPAPGIKAYISPNDTICQGATATFVAIPTIPNVVLDYQWYRNYVPIPSAMTSIYAASGLSTGDKVYCTITASASSCAGSGSKVSTDTFTMTVLPIVTSPAVTISADPGINVSPSMLVTFTANVINGGTTPKYQWYKNGVVQSGASYATWATTGLSFGDMVHVNVISEDPCAQNKNTSDTAWMQFPAGVKQVQHNTLSVFPNPCSGNFVVAGLSGSDVEIAIVNAIGQVVYSNVFQVEDGKVHINAELQRGIYLLKVQKGEALQLSRILVEH